MKSNAQRLLMSTAMTISVCGFTMLNGCKTVNTVERDKPTAEVNELQTKNVETDAFLSDKAKVLHIYTATVQGDLLKVDVEILNNKDWDGNFDYIFEWFDNQGMPVPSPTTSWQTMHVEPRETVSITAVAPTPKCKDFRLKLQRNKRS